MPWVPSAGTLVRRRQLHPGAADDLAQDPHTLGGIGRARVVPEHNVLQVSDYLKRCSHGALCNRAHLVIKEEKG